MNKGATTTNANGGTRTSTSSVGSIFSIDITLSEGVPCRPSQLVRPSNSGYRDSSGSSENYERSSLRRKGSPGNDRTASSTTASTLSTGIPSRLRSTPMSSPAGFPFLILDIAYHINSRSVAVDLRSAIFWSRNWPRPWSICCRLVEAHCR